MTPVIEGVKIGDEVKAHGIKWRVAALNEKNGHVYLERGAVGYEKGAQWVQTVTAETAKDYAIVKENSVSITSRKGLDLAD